MFLFIKQRKFRSPPPSPLNKLGVLPFFLLVHWPFCNSTPLSTTDSVVVEVVCVSANAVLITSSSIVCSASRVFHSTLLFSMPCTLWVSVQTSASFLTFVFNTFSKLHFISSISLSFLFCWLIRSENWFFCSNAASLSFWMRQSSTFEISLASCCTVHSGAMQSIFPPSLGH